MTITPHQIIRKKGNTIIDGIAYPESDGKPMADNTKQFNWIITIAGGLDAYFRENPDVFIAGDLLWYPVQGNPKIRVAPDAMVVFGRPKGERGSYIQFVENNIPPQVVFEVLSPGNTQREMDDKFGFYQRYGVEEYYIYDPFKVTLEGWQRQGDHLEQIEQMNGWISPRLGIRFDFDNDLKLFGSNGEEFFSFTETVRQKEQERQLRLEAEQRLTQERDQREQAEREAEQARQQAEKERQRAERLAARLKELNIDFDE
jgi:Uma2 family endonuclease